MKFLQCIFLIFVFSFSCFSQIESGKKNSKTKKDKKIKPEIITNTQAEEESSLVYLNYTYGNSFRILKSNGSFYGKELGDLQHETPIATGGFNLGINNKITKNLNIDFGIGFVKYGEKASKTVSDTTISHKTTYSNIVLPLKLHFEKGKKVKVFINGGLQAQLLTAYLYKNTISFDNKETITESKTLKNGSLFSLAGIGSLGVQYHFSSTTALLISGDYMQQFTSTYNKQNQYIHKANRYGFSIGLGIKL